LKNSVIIGLVLVLGLLCMAAAGIFLPQLLMPKVSVPELPELPEETVSEPKPEPEPVEEEEPEPAPEPVEMVILQPDTSKQPEEPVSEPEEPETPAESTELQQLVDGLCSSGTGRWDIRVESLSGTAGAAARTDDAPMVSASIIKLFVMAAVYDRVEQGLLNHDTVYPLIFSMITISDNYSTNELIRLLGNGDAQAGMDAVNAYAAEIGCPDSQLNRLMLADNGLQNYTSAADCATVLRMICEGTCVTAEWSAEMLSVLKEQTVVNRIPAGLPDGTACANKTGDLIALCCADVGIVWTETDAYLLCAICNQQTSEAAAVSGIAGLSADVYAFFRDNASLSAS